MVNVVDFSDGEDYLLNNRNNPGLESHFTAKGETLEYVDKNLYDAPGNPLQRGLPTLAQP
jgi:hypothetical protein